VIELMAGCHVEFRISLHSRIIWKESLLMGSVLEVVDSLESTQVGEMWC